MIDEFFFQDEGYGFKDVVKYVLLKLLLGLIYYCFYYFEVIKVSLKKFKCYNYDVLNKYYLYQNRSK